MDKLALWILTVLLALAIMGFALLVIMEYKENFVMEVLVLQIRTV